MKMQKFTGTVYKRAILYILFIPTFVFYTLVLTGCLSTSPGISNLYLVKVTAEDIKKVIKVGYFGMCGSTIDLEKDEACTPSTGIYEETVVKRLFGDKTKDPVQDLVHFGLILSNKICLPVISGAGVAFTLAVLAFGIHQLRTKGGAKKTRELGLIKSAALALFALSCVLSFGGALSITMAINAIQWLSQEGSADYQINAGKAMQALQWTAFTFSVIVTVGLASVMSPVLTEVKKVARTVFKDNGGIAQGLSAILAT